MKAEQIRELLPFVMSRTANDGTLLYGLLCVMEDCLGNTEKVIEDFRTWFDPWCAPTNPFLVFIAQWLDLERIYKYAKVDQSENGTDDLQNSKLINLIVNAHTLHSLRGSPEGIVLYLRLATGVEEFACEEVVLDPDKQQIPFHFCIKAHERCFSERRLIEKIIEQQKPAHCTFTLEFTTNF